MTRRDQLKLKYSELLLSIQKHKTLDSVCTIAVSKYSPFSDIEILYHLGHRDFGENRIESLSEKSQLAKERGLDDIRWHFIGNIQSNKLKEIALVSNLVAIHSIEKLKHLKKLYSLVDKDMDFFVQFNTSAEVEKAGLESLDDFKEFDELISLNLEHSLHFKGLMTMGKIRSDDQLADARKCFNHLNSLRDQIDKSLCTSMGMSRDFHIALEYGATHIRVGSSLFL